MIERRRAAVAFNMGGMGSAETNFYNDAFKRAGYAEDAIAIQKLWIDGKRQEAAQRVPDAMVTQFQALGDRVWARDRIQSTQISFVAARSSVGPHDDVAVNTLNVNRSVFGAAVQAYF